MTIRTLRDSLDETACEKSKQLAQIRLRRRLGMARWQGQATSITSKDNEDSGDDQNNDQTKRATVVFFDCVDVRSYPIVLGDNPSVSKGAPISIDWHHFCQDTSDLDKYEEARQNARRSKAQMRIPYSVRYDILERAGELDKTVDDVVKEMDDIRKRRRSIAHQRGWQANMEDKKETAGRWLKNILKRSEKKEEKDFIKKSEEFGIARGRELEDLSSQVKLATLVLSNI